MADLSPPADQLLSAAWLKVRFMSPPVFQVIFVVSFGSLVIVAPFTALSSGFGGFWANETETQPRIKMPVNRIAIRFFFITRQFVLEILATKKLPTLAVAALYFRFSSSRISISSFSVVVGPGGGAASFFFSRLRKPRMIMKRIKAKMMNLRTAERKRPYFTAPHFSASISVRWANFRAGVRIRGVMTLSTSDETMAENAAPM